MKTFVTGATGFVGSHLCELLSQHGHDVYGLCRNPKKFQDFKIKCHPIKGKLSHNPDDFSWVESLPQELDSIVHCAGIVHSFDEKNFLEINLSATEILLEKLITRYRDKKLHLVFISSLSAAGPCQRDQIKNEEMTENPVSVYGRSKLLAEKFLKDNTPSHWTLTILRPPMVIGPRDPAIVDIYKMVKSRIVLVPGKNGHKTQLSFISSYDLIQIIKDVLHSDQVIQGHYFTAHPQPVRYIELIYAVNKNLNNKKLLIVPIPHLLLSLFSQLTRFLHLLLGVNFRLTPDKVHEMKQEMWVCDHQKISKLLDYQFEWDIEKTLQETTADYKKRKWI